LVVGLLSGGAPTVRSLGDDAPDMANQRYRIGVALYANGRYAEAAREFEVALDLYPTSPRLAFNLGRALERAGELHGAVSAYRRYLGLERDPAQRAEVERIISALARRLDAHRGQITVRSTPAGARVYVDGRLESKGSTPLRLDFEPGPHRLRVELDRHLPVTREIEVAAGVSDEVAVTLERPAGLWRRPVGWAALGLGGASLAVGGLLYAGAADLADEADGLRGDPQRHAALRDDFELRHTGAWIALGAGAALTAAGAALVWWGPDEVAVAAYPGGASVVARW